MIKNLFIIFLVYYPLRVLMNMKKQKTQQDEKNFLY